MPRVVSYFPRVVIFLAGAATAALTMPRRERSGADPAVAGLSQAVEDLKQRMDASEAASAARLDQIETRLEDHAARLTDVPSTTQIVAAMEQLLSRTMASLDERLSTQAKSIETLKTTVSQTDSLLERVLESLDSLQSYSDPTDYAEDPLLTRPGA
jgi:uncharacterized coiled-coil protein SlyX